MTQSTYFNNFLTPGQPQLSSKRGLTANYYDQAGRLVKLENYFQFGQIADRQQFSFDADNRIVSKSIEWFGAAPGTETSDYQYDKTDQLQGADHSTATDENYAYDTIGNRTSAILVPAIHSRVQDDGTFTYTYDNEGNLKTKTRKSAAIAADHSTVYTWDYRNRLTSATQTSNDTPPVIVTTTYFYDAFDHRVNQTVIAGGVTTVTQYAYQGDQLLLARNTAGAVTDRFLPGPGGRVIAQDAAMATVIGGTTVAAGPRWLLADHEGSVRTVMSATGSVLGRVNYDSFGKITTATNPATAGSLFGYAGSVYDVASGLSYMNARYYDPASGRFLSEDPLGFAAGDMNVYRYVGNNPVNATDPTGLSTNYLGNAYANNYGGNSYFDSNFDLSGGQFAYNPGPFQYATPPNYGQSSYLIVPNSQGIAQAMMNTPAAANWQSVQESSEQQWVAQARADFRDTLQQLGYEQQRQAQQAQIAQYRQSVQESAFKSALVGASAGTWSILAELSGSSTAAEIRDSQFKLAGLSGTTTETVTKGAAAVGVKFGEAALVTLSGGTLLAPFSGTTTASIIAGVGLPLGAAAGVNEGRAAYQAYAAGNIDAAIDHSTNAAVIGTMLGYPAAQWGARQFSRVIPCTESLLQGHLGAAVERFGAEGLTPKQLAAVAKNPNLERAYKGERIHTFFAESVGTDPALQHLELTPRFQSGPDVVDPFTNRWYDVTTPGQWPAHVQKYGPNGTPLHY